MSEQKEIIDVDYETLDDFQIREPEENEVSVAYTHEMRERVAEPIENQQAAQEDIRGQKTQEEKQSKDTSFGSFEAMQKFNEKKWRDTFFGKIKRFIKKVLRICILIPGMLFVGGLIGMASLSVVGGGAAALCGGVALLGVMGFLIGIHEAVFAQVFFYLGLTCMAGGGLVLFVGIQGFSYLIRKCRQVYERLDGTLKKEDK